MVRQPSIRHNGNGQRPAPPTREGWMNLRTATRFSVDELAHAYIIYTRLYGLDANDMSIKFQGTHLIIEAHYWTSAMEWQQGRYIRHVILPLDAMKQYADSQFTQDDELIITIPKRKR